MPIEDTIPAITRSAKVLLRTIGTGPSLGVSPPKITLSTNGSNSYTFSDKAHLYTYIIYIYIYIYIYINRDIDHN